MADLGAFGLWCTIGLAVAIIALALWPEKSPADPITPNNPQDTGNAVGFTPLTGSGTQSNRGRTSNMGIMPG
jgi:hypothetical protein